MTSRARLLGSEAVWGIGAVLEFFNEVGFSSIEERNRDLADDLMEGLNELRVKVNTPHDIGKNTGLVTFMLGKHDENLRLFNELHKAGIVVALMYAATIGGIRVSCHFFNREEEIEALLAIVNKTLV